jgi:hypothetical protein
MLYMSLANPQMIHQRINEIFLNKQHCLDIIIIINIIMYLCEHNHYQIGFFLYYVTPYCGVGTGHTQKFISFPTGKSKY